MNTKLMVAALRRASNGAELLRFLDAITEPSGAQEAASEVVYGNGQPTLDPVAF